MTVLRAQIPVISTLSLMAVSAAAMPIDTDSDIQLNWDNTFQATVVEQPGTQEYSPAGRCLPAGGEDAAEAAMFSCTPRSGLVSTRLEWLSQVTLRYQNYGLQASSYGSYDPVYTSWRGSVAPALSGMNETAYFSNKATDSDAYIELYDAFLYGTTSLGADHPFSFRLGRQVTLWGESLYFVQNGIAGGQAPVDGYRYQADGYSPANTSFLPVGEGSFSWQPASGLSIIGYYQFEWRQNRINPYSPYDSTMTILAGDDLDDDTQQIVLPVGRAGTPVTFNRTGDMTPGSNDQFGLGLRWQQGEFDWGFYGLSFNAKTPELYFRLPASISQSVMGSYNLVFPKDIEATGISVSGPLGDASFGAELSARVGMPLVNAGILLPSGDELPADNDAHPRYPIGDTLHAQFSWLYTTPPLPGIQGGANWTGEVAANDLLAATDNADELVPGRTRAAAALRTVFEPQFFQVLPRLDLSVPIGLGYNFLGLSEIDSTMNRGTADLSIGATVTLDQSWKFTLNATHYIGVTENAFLPMNPVRIAQPLNQGDFVSLGVQTSF
jgi:hypothetical protein